LFSSSSSSVAVAVESGVSRIDTLQTLLSKHGAPGSLGCRDKNDLVPLIQENGASILNQEDELINLHPHLYPIAKSTSTGNYICALRRAYADDAEYQSSSSSPWPIVESAPNAPGMHLLALNSEHLMRRIACESDVQEDGEGEEIISIYNQDLGKGLLSEYGLDTRYEPGSVEELGYGLDKYVLLRVGPFPDLYAAMSRNHKARGDESSSLIAAEAANSKFVGFGSSFLAYGSLLNSYPNREEESRDAVRMCLRLPLPSIGLTLQDFKKVGVLGQLTNEDDTMEETLTKLQEMYEKIRASEEEDNQQPGGNNKTPEQRAIDEANYLLDTTALTSRDWAAIRGRLADIYASAGKEDMAAYVDPNRG